MIPEYVNDTTCDFQSQVIKGIGASVVSQITCFEGSSSPCCQDAQPTLFVDLPPIAPMNVDGPRQTFKWLYPFDFIHITPQRNFLSCSLCTSILKNLQVQQIILSITNFQDICFIFELFFIYFYYSSTCMHYKRS